MISNTDPLRRIYLEKLEAVIPYHRHDGVVDIDSAIQSVFASWEDQDEQEYNAFIAVAAHQGAKTFHQRQEQSRRSKSEKEHDEIKAVGDPGTLSVEEEKEAEPTKEELDYTHYFPGIDGEMRGGDASPELWLALGGRYEREERQKGGWKTYCRNMYKVARAKQLRLGYSEDATLYQIFGYK